MREGEMRSTWVMWLVACLAAGCAMRTEEGELGSRSEAVQQQFESLGKYRFADGTNEVLLPAVGNILHYRSITLGGKKLDMGSCGATFVSQHFGITASHCVDGIGDGPFTDPGEFFVDHLDVSAVADGVAEAEGQVTGNWPNWETGSSADPPPGYQQTRLRCRVRCGRVSDGFSACTSGTSTADLALIECPTRSDNAYAYVANTAPAVGDKVEVWWFHEYLNLPAVGATGDPRWDRYGRFADLDGDGERRDDNFHYLWYHLMWPLVGDTDAAGNPATVTSTIGSNTNTNLFGCHGTSGSGVFGRGSTAMHGPVSGGGFGTLCGHGLNPVRQGLTRQLEQLSFVLDDRNGVYTPSF